MACPNLLVVMSDQQRRDSLGAYGNVFVETPHLDAFARDATVFDRACTVWPICTPARATMWTGLYPHRHGIEANIYGASRALERGPDSPGTVFDRLRDAGYATGYVGKWHLGRERPACFEHWHGFNSLGSHWEDGRHDFQGGRYMADLETDLAIGLVRDAVRARRPFALVLSWYPPHDPYLAPAAILERYRGKGIPFPGYYAAITALDVNFGRLMAALEQCGARDDTLIAYTSDHGDTFRYREGMPHKMACFDDAIRIPLVVAAPGGRRDARRSDAAVGLQDLAPTLLDYAGVDDATGMQGRSLRPWIEGAEPPADGANYVQNRHWPHFRFVARGSIDYRPVGPWVQRCLRTRAWKLILTRDGPSSLYDLVRDPEEELDLWGTPKDDDYDRYRHFGDHSGVVRTLAAELATHADAIGDRVGVDLATRAMAGPVVPYVWGPPAG